MRHVTHINESCRKHQSVMLHINEHTYIYMYIYIHTHTHIQCEQVSRVVSLINSGALLKQSTYVNCTKNAHLQLQFVICTLKFGSESPV